MALTALGMLAGAALLFAVGLWLTGSDSCRGACETLGLTLLYAGGPVSALFGVIGGAVLVAWPVDAMAWILLAALTVRVSERRTVPITRAALMIAAGALAYGFALSFLVEVA